VGDEKRRGLANRPEVRPHAGRTAQQVLLERLPLRPSHPDQPAQRLIESLLDQGHQGPVFLLRGFLPRDADSSGKARQALDGHLAAYVKLPLQVPNQVDPRFDQLGIGLHADAPPPALDTQGDVDPSAGEARAELLPDHRLQGLELAGQANVHVQIAMVHGLHLDGDDGVRALPPAGPESGHAPNHEGAPSN
jgi:hypothetical protein